MNETPSLTESISVRLPGNPKISESGKYVAFTISDTDWRENRYIRSLYLYDRDNGSYRRLTRTYNVQQIRWTDEEQLIVKMSDLKGKEEGKKPQLYIFENNSGEPIRLTNMKEGVSNFEVKQDRIFIIADDERRAEKKDRKEKFGKLEYVEREKSASTIYYMDLPRQLEYKYRTTYLDETVTKDEREPLLDLSRYLDEELKLTGIVVLDDRLYINARKRDDLIFYEDTSHFELKLNFDEALQEYLDYEVNDQDDDNMNTQTKSNENTSNDGDELWSIQFGEFELNEVTLPPASSIIEVSPDETKLLISFSPNGPAFYNQDQIGIIDVDAITSENPVDNMSLLTQDLDRDFFNGKWASNNPIITYFDYSNIILAELTTDGKIIPKLEDNSVVWDFDVNRKGDTVIHSTSPDKFPEIYLLSGDEIIQVTTLGEQIRNWNVGSRESITWESKDGTEIEGVLFKPEGFDPDKEYGLLFVVHGGPTWLSTNSLIEGGDLRYYPVLQFLDSDFLILKPNYRGSVGRNEEFKQLNKGNLGIGDQWDLESGLEFLQQSTGIKIDNEKVGCMGWSQGGFISAFMGTQSEKMKAVSMGAGISSWYTYYIANDIRHWAHYYLLGNPLEEVEQYKITAPIKDMEKTDTPFLIQHGENDKRVPISNALEMQRLLEDAGREAHLFVFKEFQHGITKPRENRAIMNQNLQWFLHKLNGEKLDFFKLNEFDELEE